ncbi:hypothetical protein [Brasilonema sp. UFV-L1]|uniref:hypothetical protein n=1 Tax=Brasilonema sp. UFV-L1 TaxID=2234130 RepID=UPI0030DC5ECF
MQRWRAIACMYRAPEQIAESGIGRLVYALHHHTNVLSPNQASFLSFSVTYWDLNFTSRKTTLGKIYFNFRLKNLCGLSYGN